MKLADNCQIKLNENQTYSIKYADLTEIKILGSGEFGVVKKMLHEPTKLEFAVKVLINWLKLIKF